MCVLLPSIFCITLGYKIYLCVSVRYPFSKLLSVKNCFGVCINSFYNYQKICINFFHIFVFVCMLSLSLGKIPLCSLYFTSEILLSKNTILYGDLSWYGYKTSILYTNFYKSSLYINLQSSFPLCLKLSLSKSEIVSYWWLRSEHTHIFV